MQHLLSKRITSLPSSATLAMSQKATDLQARGYDIINLSLGEPDFKTPAHIQSAAKQAIDSGNYFGYPPVAGYADLRAAIAEKLTEENNIPCTSKQIVVSNGAKQAIANVFSCLLNPGDEVIVYTPYWVSYISMIQLAEGQPVLIKGDPENNFEVTPAQLAQAITPKTKAVIFSSPCNPTGHMLTQQTLEEMAMVLIQHPQVLVISDEIYEYVNFGSKHISIGALPSVQDQVVTINGFSKSFAMTGWRIGYMAGPLWLAKACEKLQGQTTSAPSSIAQRAALAALQGDRVSVRMMTTAYQERRDFCLSAIKEIPGLRCSEPMGAFFLFPDVSAYFDSTYEKTTIKNAEDLCMYLLQEAHVSLAPGGAFGTPQHIRLSYAAAEEQLQTAMQRIKCALAQLKIA